MRIDKSLLVTLTKAVAFSVVTLLATAALAGTIRNSTSGEGTEYAAVFENATSLNKGDDVRMAGVKVGTVQAVEVSDNQFARVTFTVADSAPMRTGTSAELRFRNMVGQRYIALTPGDAGAAELPAGATLDLDHTQPALDLTLLFNGFQPLMRLLDAEDVNELSGQIIEVFQGEGATVDGLLTSTARLTSTLADRDQVIGDLITNLNQVLTVVGDRSDQLDTTLVTLQQLVSGLAEDRVIIGDTITGMGELSASVADLLDEGRAPIKRSIQGLGDLSASLAGGDELDEFLSNLPGKLESIGRLASYGSWINFYLCSLDGRIPLPEGYYGDLGALPVAERCI